MADVLNATEFFKLPNKSRPDRKAVFLDKYRNQKPFEVKGSNRLVVFVPEPSVLSKISDLQPGDKVQFENIRLKGLDGKYYKMNQLKKTKEFGGGGGSGAGAELTEFTESGQCYVCSVVYNILQRPIVWEDLTYENLKEGAKYVDTGKTSLDQIIEKSPPEWVQSYVKTANIMYANYQMKPGKKVQFHRDSRFMNKIYEYKSLTQKKDKESETPQAPGTFANDKWNPGDIWMTTLDSVPELPTDSWMSLNSEIYRLAQERVMLGVSLKKIIRTPKIDEYNSPKNSKQRYNFQNFRLSAAARGKGTPFFDSIDMYMTISGQEVQFRATSGSASWQGEIKGATAAGGKIGGGNVNFFLKKYTGRELFNKSESEITNYAKTTNETFWKDFYTLYTRWFNHNKLNPSLGDNPVPYDSFKQLATDKTKDPSGGQAYLFSKYMNMKFLDIFLSAGDTAQQNIVSDLFLYGASSTDQSSFFIKVYE